MGTNDVLIWVGTCLPKINWAKILLVDHAHCLQSICSKVLEMAEIWQSSKAYVKGVIYKYILIVVFNLGNLLDRKDYTQDFWWPKVDPGGNWLFLEVGKSGILRDFSNLESRLIHLTKYHFPLITKSFIITRHIVKEKQIG